MKRIILSLLLAASGLAQAGAAPANPPPAWALDLTEPPAGFFTVSIGAMIPRHQVVAGNDPAGLADEFDAVLPGFEFSGGIYHHEVNGNLHRVGVGLGIYGYKSDDSMDLPAAGAEGEMRVISFGAFYDYNLRLGDSGWFLYAGPELGLVHHKMTGTITTFVIWPLHNTIEKTDSSTTPYFGFHAGVRKSLTDGRNSRAELQLEYEFRAEGSAEYEVGARLRFENRQAHLIKLGFSLNF